MASNEDDFWNESSSSRLNFFDDDEDSSFTSTDTLRSDEKPNFSLPIHSLISNKCLKLILDDTDSAIEVVNPPCEDTVKRMFYSENFVLNTYRSLAQKLKLLDAALEFADGVGIITVILFLSKTLNRNIFWTELSKRKVAIRHYSNYLIERGNLQDLADLYMATGNIHLLRDIYCLIAKDASNENVLLKNIKQFSVQHAQNLFANEDKQEISDNLSLLEFQILNKITQKSLVQVLIQLCTTEWENGRSDDTINNFKKRFKVDDFQFEWVIMSVLCKTQNWDKLLSTFVKSLWVLKKRSLKSVIRPELIVSGIGRYGPPEYVMEQFLSCMSDNSQILYLAEKFKLHKYIINYYIEQKDKLALLKYMEKVEPGSPAMYTIQASLNNMDIKWKN